MKKANLVAVLFGTAIVAGGGFFLASKKKKTEPTAGALPPSTPGVTAVPGSVAVQYPTFDTALQSRVMTAVASNDPARMRAEAQKLRAEGYTDSGNSLDAYAASVETNAAVVQGAMQNVANVLAQPVPQVARGSQSPPQVPQPPQPPPVNLPPAATPQPTYPTAPEPVPSSPPTTDFQLPGMTGPIQVPTNIFQQAQQALPTLISTMTGAPSTSSPVVTTGSPLWPGASDPAKMAVATAMNLNLASSAKGKENKNLVKQFQTQEQGAAGAVDGLYGPKVAMILGSQYGIIPAMPLYWSSKSPIADQKADYAEFLTMMADTDPVRFQEWNQAAVRVTQTV